jgi:DtxR family Mn-dependent transcriptional regulator
MTNLPPATAIAEPTGISSSMEDYLQAVYVLSRSRPEVRVKEIAYAMGVSLPSVTSALKTLGSAGLVRHERYRTVELTAEGRERAEAIIQCHGSLIRFLTEILLIEGEVAEREACALEHAISRETLHRLVSLMRAMQECPRGSAAWLGSLHERWRGELCGETCDPCVVAVDSSMEAYLKRAMEEEGLAAAGAVTLVPLSECAPGTAGVVRVVEGRGPSRRRLADMGVGRDAEVEVERVAPLGDPLDVLVRGYHLCLRRQEASRILVEVSHQAVTAR